MENIRSKVNDESELTGKKLTLNLDKTQLIHTSLILKSTIKTTHMAEFRSSFS